MARFEKQLVWKPSDGCSTWCYLICYDALFWDSERLTFPSEGSTKQKCKIGIRINFLFNFAFSADADAVVFISWWVIHVWWNKSLKSSSQESRKHLWKSCFFFKLGWGWVVENGEYLVSTDKQGWRFSCILISAKTIQELNIVKPLPSHHPHGPPSQKWEVVT